MANGELGDEAADRIEDRVERVAVAGDDHPRGECTGAFLAECIEALVDDDPRIGFPGAGALDRLGDAAVDRVGDRFRKFALKAGGRPEMMEEVRMGSADLRGDGLQGDPLRPLLEQQLSRRGKGGGATFFRGEAGPSY